MKKHILKSFILLLFSSFLFVACEEDEVVKEDYDVDHDANPPQMDANSPEVVSFSHSIINVSGENASEEMGVFISENEDLDSPSVWPLEEAENGSLRVTGLEPEKTYYYATYGINENGATAHSEIQSFTTNSAETAYMIDSEASSAEAWEELSTLDIDGDGLSWMLTPLDEDGDVLSMVSYSWLDSPLTPNNYLLFPPIEHDGEFGMFTYTVQAMNSDFPAEKLKLVVSEDPITADNVEDVEVLNEHTLSDGDPTSTSVDVPRSYEGKTIYFGLAHFDVTDQYAVAFLNANFRYAIN